MNRTTVKTALYTIFASMLAPKTVIWADQDAPAPATPYFTIKIISSVQLHEAATQLPTTSAGIIQHSIDNDFSVDVRGFGAGVNEALESIRTKLVTDAIHYVLELAGIAFIDLSPVVDLTHLEGPRHIESTQCELRFRTIESIQETVSTIANVEGTGEINGSIEIEFEI